MLFCIGGPFRHRDPITAILPARGARMPVSSLSAVLFPAPLRPSKPATSALFSVKEMSCSTSVPS